MTNDGKGKISQRKRIGNKRNRWKRMKENKR